MALERLFNPATRWLIAHPFAFADWQKPTSAELNARNGLVYEITCAVNQDGSNFDLGDSETDESLTFCQVSGASNPTSLSPEITIETERSTDPRVTNTANTAYSLLARKGVEYFAILSVGETPNEAFAPGHRIKMAKVATDYGVPVFGNGENVRLSQSFAQRGDVNWNYELTV